MAKQKKNDFSSKFRVNDEIRFNGSVRIVGNGIESQVVSMTEARKIAEDIKTYILYCQLLLLLINNLIGDYNYKSAIFYCQVLFKVINVAFKIINKKQLAKKYFFKFFIYLGFNYLFIGLCLEQKEDSRQNNENCYYSYKQANFFFSLTDESKKKEKTIFLSLLGQSNENSAFMLTQLIISKFQKMHTITSYIGKKVSVFHKPDQDYLYYSGSFLIRLCCHVL